MHVIMSFNFFISVCPLLRKMSTTGGYPHNSGGSSPRTNIHCHSPRKAPWEIVAGISGGSMMCGRRPPTLRAWLPVAGGLRQGFLRRPPEAARRTLLASEKAVDAGRRRALRLSKGAGAAANGASMTRLPRAKMGTVVTEGDGEETVDVLSPAATLATSA